MCEDRVGLPRRRTPCEDRRPAEGITASGSLASGHRGRSKADERETLLDLLAAEPSLTAARPGQTLIGDKNYFGRDFEHQLAEQDIRLLRPARKGEAERPGASLFKPLRQVIESVNESFKGQLNLEQHRGRNRAA